MRTHWSIGVFAVALIFVFDLRTYFYMRALLSFTTPAGSSSSRYTTKKTVDHFFPRNQRMNPQAHTGTSYLPLATRYLQPLNGTIWAERMVQAL